MIVRPDIFIDKKGVHIKLDKDVHAALRAKTFQYNIAMSEIFEEFAKLIVLEDNKATKIVEQLIIRKAENAINKTLPGPRRGYKHRVDELDHNTLYDLIDRNTDK